MMIRQTATAAAALALLLPASSGRSLLAPAAGKHLLKAATATVNGKTEVRLRWMVTDGWISAGRGFNVYRVENGKRTGPLNGAAPITVHEEMAPAILAPKL